jgi:uncharacterized protein YjeT (DUF2065 family)
MAESIAIFASINFVVIGLSHICQWQAWCDFFQKLHSMGNSGAFANGMITLLMGSLIVSFHHVWTGVPVILTLIGWGYILKATAIFVYPQWNLRSMKSVKNSPKLKFRIAGTAMLGVALTILLSVVFGQYS